MYHNLYNTLCEMLQRYDRQDDMSPSDLEVVHMLTDTIKNLDKIEMLEGEGESFRDNSYNTYDDGGMSSRTRVRGYYRSDRNRGGRRNSYADGGMSGDSYRGSYRNSYYRGGSYDSYAETVEQLRELMQNADEREKKVLQHAISQIENGQ